MSLHIPEDHKMTLISLVKAPEESFSRLIAALRGVPRGLGFASLRPIVFDAFPNLPGLADVLGGVLTAFASTERSESFERDFVEALVREEAGLDVELVTRRFGLLVQLENLRQRAKATALQVDHASVFNSASIATDIRPVFCEALELGVDSTLLIHQLRITSFVEGRVRHAFFAMDEEDLRALKKVILRAEQKAEAINNLLDLKAITRTKA